MKPKVKTLQIDVGMQTYTKLCVEPSTGKFYIETRWIGERGKFTEITRDDVLMKLTLPIHRCEWQRSRNQRNITKYLPEAPEVNMQLVG